MKTTIVMSLLAGSALCAPAQISVPADGPVLFGKQMPAVDISLNPLGSSPERIADFGVRLVDVDSLATAVFLGKMCCKRQNTRRLHHR